MTSLLGGSSGIVQDHAQTPAGGIDEMRACCKDLHCRPSPEKLLEEEPRSKTASDAEMA